MWECYWGVWTESWGRQPDRIASPIPGQKYWYTCLADGRYESVDYLVYQPGAAPLPTISAAELAGYARDDVPLPALDISLNPDVDIDQLVGLDTWFWAHGPSMAATQATAQVDGWWSTATATATSIRIDPGDGSEPIVCHGGGAAYNTNRPSRFQESDCTHTWVWSGRYTVTATLTWAVTYDSNIPDNPTGTLDPLTTTATIPVRVVEAQPVLRD